MYSKKKSYGEKGYSMHILGQNLKIEEKLKHFLVRILMMDMTISMWLFYDQILYPLAVEALDGPFKWAYEWMK